jgi:hypothetical protein
MINDLRHELEKFEDDELIQRISKKWLTEEANRIAIGILEERGCENISLKIEEAKESLIVEEKLGKEKDKRQRNFFILQALIVFSILPTMFFPIGENPTPPILVFIFMELLALPVSIAILKGHNKKTIGILVLAVLIIPIIGWLLATIYSIIKSVQAKTTE